MENNGGRGKRDEEMKGEGERETGERANMSPRH